MGIDDFCGGEFWNLSLTWYTEDPQFTRCFEKTALVWFPCLFLWILSPLEYYFLNTSKTRNVPWSWVNITKLGITGALIVVLAAELATIFQAVSNEQVVYDVDFYTPLIKALTIAFSGVLVYYNRKYGMHTSGLLFIFWFLLTLCGIPQLRTEIRNSQNDNVHPDLYGAHLTYIIYWVLIAVMFLLNCLSDKQPLERMYEKQENPLPEKSASYLSRLVFAWFDPLVLLGYKKPLEQTDLWEIAPENSAKEIVPEFEKHWFKSVENAKKKNKNASFLPSLFKTFGTMFMVGAFFRFVTDVMIFVSPNILGYLINFVSQKQEFWKGILYAVLLFVSATFQSLLSQQFMNLNLIVSMRIRTSIISLIYKKALVISNAARKQSTVGEIVNLMSVDAQRFGDVGNTINILWSAPLQIGLATYFLWQELGPSTLAGLAVLLLLFPINGVVARISKKLFMKNMKNKDERVKMMNEILSGIRVLKLYAWEESFEKQVLKVRDRELKVMKQSRYLHAVTSFVMNITPFMVALASFTTFVFVDEKNILDASKAFVSISLFNIIRGPLLQLPMIITNLLEMFVSVKRLNTFFNAEEISPDNVYHEPNKEYPVTVEKGTFSWGTDPIIKDINIKIQTKTLVAIVGPVGAGKSSLLSALLGEMVKITGKVNTYGSIAYVPQQAWIQNATLMENILFGKPYDKQRYDAIINACALKSDFEILPAGDQTEIGEKGINLSGGQKQRVSLARAVYCEADVYFLDDPLSAVDSHVGKHIFDHVIGPKGLLKNKTKLLVTHGVTYLPQTDQIIVLKDGFVSENGTYQQLLHKKGDFADFLLQHISSGDVDDAELEELKDQLADTPMVEEIQRRLSRQNSRVSVTLSDSASELQSTDSLARKPSREGSMKSKGGGPGGRGGPGGPGGPGQKGGKMTRGQRLIEKEKAEIGNVKLDVYKYYLDNVGFNMIFFLFLVQVVSQAFGVGSNAWLGKWTDDDELYVDGVINTFKRDLYLGVYGAIGFGQAVTVILYNVIYAIATIAAASKIHKLLLQNTLRLPTHFFDTTPIGRILARFSSDMNGVDGMLPMTFQMVMSNGIRVISTLVVISYSTPWFVTVIIPLFIVYYLIQRFYIATSRQLRRLVSITRSPIYTHFGETITGIQTIRAYGQQDRFNLESHKRIDQNQVSFYPEMTAGRWLAIRLELIGNLIIFFSAIFAVLAKDLSPALVGLSVSYSLQITQTLKWLVHMASNVETSIVAVERIKEYQETKQEAPWEKPDKLKKNWPENGTVEFINYGVRYREGLDLVLKDFNIRIEAGEKVGIVGRTGAGKSSLTLALFRLIEGAEGRIEVDGVNIADLGLHKLRSALTIIPQDPVLFAGTLRANVDPFSKYSDEEIWTALEHAHLKNFVKGLPAGLQHEITEGGQNLSVGQKQLICLARALLRKTKILILDEATAAIDLETDDLIQKTIRTEFVHCTVLTIAHRLNTIMDSNRIMVLDKGRVVEFDTPQALLDNKDSVFSSLHKDAAMS